MSKQKVDTDFKVGEKCEIDGTKGIVLDLKGNIASVYVLDGANAGQTKMIEVKEIKSMDKGTAELQKSLSGMSDDELKLMLGNIRRERTGVTGRVKRGKVARNVANQASKMGLKIPEDRVSRRKGFERI